MATQIAQYALSPQQWLLVKAAAAGKGFTIAGDQGSARQFATTISWDYDGAAQLSVTADGWFSGKALGLIGAAVQDAQERAE